MDEAVILHAKEEASRRGKSVSQMVGDFFDSLGTFPAKKTAHPPITTSLVGVLKGRRVSEADYKKHLKEKYL